MTTRPRRFAAALLATAAITCTTATPNAVAAPKPQRLAAAVQDRPGTVDVQRIKARTTPPGRATDATRALDTSVADLVRAGAIGTTARVTSPATTWSGAAGLRDKDGKAPAGRQDRFRAASNTKMMIATLVLQEVERGSWSLDTTVAEIDPTLLPHHGDVTLRQLLSHTSGMPSGTTELMVANMTDYTSYEQMLAAVSRDYTPRDMIGLVDAAPWGTPGEFFYSNGGYVTLGALLEAHTGQSLESLLKKRIFKPAGMHHTSYATDPELRGPALHEDAWLGPDGWLELDGFDPDFFGASGAMVSTTDDLQRFTRALLTGKLVSPALVDEMLTPVTTTGYEYGLGIYRVADPCPSNPADPYLYGHDGAAFGTLSAVYTSRDGKRSVSLAASGRDLTALPGRVDVNPLLITMLQASCTK